MMLVLIQISCSKNPKKKADIEKSYAEAPETDDTIVDDEGGVAKFNGKFAHLGPIINFLLDDTVDTDIRVHKARKYVGALHFLFGMMRTYF